MTRTKLLKAMEAAEEAFEECLEEDNYDPAFFDLQLTGYLMTDDFKPRRIAKFLPEHQATSLSKQVSEGESE